MANQSLVSTSNSASLLRRTFFTNMAATALSGILLVVASDPIARFMGLGSPLPMLLIGVGFLLFAALVYRVASQPAIDVQHARAIAILDVAYVVASAIVLAADLFSLTSGGRWAILLVGDLVLVFAVLEFVGLRRLS
jgi:hypothetical protein